MFVNMLKKLFRFQSKACYCTACGNKKVTFVPLPDMYREKADAYGFKHFGNGEMLSVEAYSCAKCGASDRERLYALWVGEQIEKGLFKKDMRVIHFAPEASLSAKLKSMNWFDYKTADLFMDNVDYKVDMMDMQFEDESVDFFICSHVLEHVESDDKAIKELFRITKLGGCGILVAPIIIGLRETVEDSSVMDEAGRWRLFGQNDHVRLYGHDDYVNKIRSHGFSVDELGQSYFGEEVFRKLGLTSTSVLYVVYK